MGEWAGKQKCRPKNHLLLQLEGIEANINTLQMRKLQCGEVKSLAQGHGVIKCSSLITSSVLELVSAVKAAGLHTDMQRKRVAGVGRKTL